MGYLLPALTDRKFENQRDVVLNERRQNYENRPYGFAGMAIVAALFPPDHPYHWLTIGDADDLRAAQLDDVRAFFQTYYRPRNASLALAGDVDSDDGARARRAVLRRSLDAGDAPPPVNALPPPPIARDVRLLLEDRVELPRLYLAWHSPALFAAGDAELDLVAEVLASGKTSRLYRALVYDHRIATEIAASQNSREIGGFFQIVATAAPGRTLAELERAITERDRRVRRRRADRRRDGALPGAGGGAFHLPAADGRRVRRQVRSAERLQRVPRTIPDFFDQRPGSLPARRRRRRCSEAAALAARRPPRRPQRRADGAAANSRSQDSQPVAVS